MSYDFWIEVDTGGEDLHAIEPYFSDQHPVLASDGAAGNVLVTATGHARCGNYTSNVSRIWSRCLTAALRQLNSPSESHPLIDWTRDDGTLSLGALGDSGIPGRDLVELLTVAVEWGVEHLDELRELNPSNGWGSAEGALTYLWDIQRLCEAHPNGRLVISR